MTSRRPPARLLMRLLAVVGGAFVLLLLGAAAAGAAESRSAAPPGGPIRVTVPLPASAAPLLPPGTGIAVHAPGMTVDAGGGGVAVAADPVGFVPRPPDLPLPLPSPTIPSPPALPLPVPRPVDPASASHIAEPSAHARAAVHGDAVTPRATSIATPARPHPAGPSHPMPNVPFTIAIGGLALGLQLTTRHDGLDDHLVTSGIVGAIRRLVPAGWAALARALAPRPGYALLLTRPG